MRSDANLRSRGPVRSSDDADPAEAASGTPYRSAVDSRDNALLRILVLDTNSATPQQIEKALWIWPHRISVAGDANSAIKMCRHMEPAALIVSPDNTEQGKQHVIRVLRQALPKTVIIALATAAKSAKPRLLLDLGASAVLTRDELQRPTLHELLMRLRAPACEESIQVVMASMAMALPWRDSQIVGSLICDIKGTIHIANDCLVRWLDYSRPKDLAGKCVWRDVLGSKAEWEPWKTVAGDMTALLRQTTAVRANSEQLLWMDVEVFAAPNSPTDIQAIFVDQSELVHLTNRSNAS